jgi:hypothetical protein
LAKAWEHPAAFEPRLAKFTIDHRGTRRGFPLDVALDLANLKSRIALNDVPVKQGFRNRHVD